MRTSSACSTRCRQPTQVRIGTVSLFALVVAVAGIICGGDGTVTGDVFGVLVVARTLDGLIAFGCGFGLLHRRVVRFRDRCAAIGRLPEVLTGLGILHPLAVGERVKLKTFADVDGTRRFAGTLVGANDAGFVIEIEGETKSFDYDTVSKARTVFEWGGNPKPGGGKQPGSGPATKPKREAQQ